MKSFLVIGLGRFGKHLAYQLTTLGHEVMAIDRDESRVNESMNFVSGAQIGDSNNKEFLKEGGAEGYEPVLRGTDVFRFRTAIPGASLKFEPEPMGPQFISAVGDDSITRFDKPKKSKGKNRNRGNRKNGRGKQSSKEQS